jgi:hypothetical protein
LRGSRCACASRSRNGTRARRLHTVGEGSLAVPGGGVSLLTTLLLLPSACHRHYCRPISGRIDRCAFSRGWLTRDRCARLALSGHAQGRLESRHRLRSRGDAVLARVAVQFLTCSNRCAGYMTCGPGPPCWTRRSRKGAPPWCGCMPPAWRSALSPAGPGDSGGTLVNRWAVVRTARGGFGSFSPRSACMTRGTQPPCCRGRTLECVGEDSVRAS